MSSWHPCIASDPIDSFTHRRFGLRPGCRRGYLDRGGVEGQTLADAIGQDRVLIGRPIGEGVESRPPRALADPDEAQSSQLLNDCRAEGGRIDAALGRAKTAPTCACNSINAVPNVAMLRSCTAGMMSRSTSRQSRSVTRSGYRGQTGKCLQLARTVKAVHAAWLDHQDRPFLGKGQPRHQRRDGRPFVSPAIDDQATGSEPVKPDPRPMAAAGEPGQLFEAGLVSPGQIQDGARHRQADLGPDTESHVLGRCSQDPDTCRPETRPRIRQLSLEASDESLDPMRQHARDLPMFGRLGRQLDVGCPGSSGRFRQTVGEPRDPIPASRNGVGSVSGCARNDASWWCGPQVRVETASGGGFAEMFIKQLKGDELGRAARLPDDHLEFAEFDEHFLQRKPCRSSSQHRRLEHGMFRPVESEEITESSSTTVATTIRARSS